MKAKHSYSSILPTVMQSLTTSSFMAKQTFIRWFNLLRKDFDPIQPDEKEIFLISGHYNKELIPPILQKYFSNINITRLLKDFTFLDIFFKSFHFAGRPRKENLSLYDRFKRIAVHYLHDDYERTANIWNLVDLIFLSSPEKCMFIASVHIVEIFKVHFPDYQVLELSGHTNSLRNRFIYMLARLSRKHFSDISEGITVFANLADPNLLKAYRLLHPNKKVYVRFHDNFNSIVKKTSSDELRKILHQLIEENVINGVDSYYESDAISLNIPYRPNAVNSTVMEKVNWTTRHYLYTFIGTHNSRKDHSRLQNLQIIRKKLSELYPSAERYINERIILDLSERVSYSKYLEMIGLSEIVVDMYRTSPYEGFSFRIPEALFLERKVITNRLIVLDCDFYHSSRFFIIGYDSTDRLKEFMENDFRPLPPEIRNRYDCSNWW